MRLPQDSDAAREERRVALDEATLAAAGPPRRILAAAAELAELAAAVAERGNVNLVGDATTAAVIAESAGPGGGDAGRDRRRHEPGGRRGRGAAGGAGRLGAGGGGAHAGAVGCRHAAAAGAVAEGYS